EVLEADSVIIAIGQASDLSFITPEDGIEITPRGTIAVDPDTLATSIPGIFAGGDVTTGAASVIGAVALGHKAAISIDTYLRGEDLSALRFEELIELGKLSEKTIESIKRLEREKAPTLSLEERSNNYLEVELGYSEVMAVRAAHRCLTCGAGATADGDKCTACLTCVRVCPYEVPTIEDRIAKMDITQCQACGICASECPARAITLKLYQEEEIIAQIERLLTAAPLSNPGPTLLGFCCRYCAYADGESAEAVKAQLPPNVKVVELLCTGKLDVAYLLKAFELGADGVFVVGCPEEDCHNKSGSFRARKRVEYVKGLLDEVGLGGERLEMYNVPSDSWGKVASLAAERMERVKELGPNPLRRSMEV
ncbi:MAG: hydrogenase iron-sulfur subunit, partial [Dehalococcoidia bacterium]